MSSFSFALLICAQDLHLHRPPVLWHDSRCRRVRRVRSVLLVWLKRVCRSGTTSTGGFSGALASASVSPLALVVAVALGLLTRYLNK